MNAPSQRESIRVSSEAREEFERLALESYPNEACGTLIGHRVDTNTFDLSSVHPGRNLAADAEDHFDLHPADIVLADRMARRSGLEVIGIWHSHPDQPARLSNDDLESAWGGWIQLIVSVGPDGARDLRAWRVGSQSPPTASEFRIESSAE